VPFAEFASENATPEPPPVKRAIPKHPVGLLVGCGEADLRLVAQHLQQAIDAAGPLYANGQVVATYHLTEGASLDAERKLPVACRGPRKALGDARRKAASLKDPMEQVWAIRDGYDGLLDVIGRTLEK